MTSIPPHWLRPALLFFLYIFAIPPGWFGRIRKPLHSKPHNTSINPSITNPNSEPLNSSEAFSQPRASVPVSLGLWDTALKFLSPGPRKDVTDHLEGSSQDAQLQAPQSTSVALRSPQHGTPKGPFVISYRVTDVNYKRKKIFESARSLPLSKARQEHRSLSRLLLLRCSV